MAFSSSSRPTRPAAGRAAARADAKTPGMKTRPPTRPAMASAKIAARGKTNPRAAAKRPLPKPAAGKPHAVKPPAAKTLAVRAKAKGGTVKPRAAAAKPAARGSAASRASASRIAARKPAGGLVKKAVARRAAPPPPARPVPRPAGEARQERERAREQNLLAVNRSLDLLEALARTGPVPLPVLAASAGFGKTAALEMLVTLRKRNFVIQDEAHGLWRLGARWAVLGRAASEQGALAATAMPHLMALGKATGENVYLRVRTEMEVETVAIYQTDPGLRIYTEVGKKMPLHAGTGRLLLAYAPEAVQTQVLAQRLQRYTPSTRIDPNWIAGDLHRIRQRGFVITDSEVVAGTVTVCAPVRDASGQVVAALLIAAPSLRMRPPRPRALMPVVVDIARKLSQALGAAPDEPAETPTAAGSSGEKAPAGAARAVAAPAAWPASPANGAAQTRVAAPPGVAAPSNVAALGASIARPHSIFR